jgi:DNA gyrase subunit B
LASASEESGAARGEGIGKLFVQIEAVGLSMDDYFLTQEESVAAKSWRRNMRFHKRVRTNIAGVGQILPEVLGDAQERDGNQAIQGAGRDEQRGALADDARSDQAGAAASDIGAGQSEAEQMFSVLMGEDVERRRQFIEEHALEVKNLDV